MGQDRGGRRFVFSRGHEAHPQGRLGVHKARIQSLLLNDFAKPGTTVSAGEARHQNFLSKSMHDSRHVDPLAFCMDFKCRDAVDGPEVNWASLHQIEQRIRIDDQCGGKGHGDWMAWGLSCVFGFGSI